MKSHGNLHSFGSRLAIALALLVWGVTVCAHRQHRVLVIASYNPDIPRMHTTLSDFNDAVNELDSNHVQVMIESMNCKNLSEAYKWKGKMAAILDRYRKTPPELIILLGQEAWASYVSQETDFARRTPCMVGLVSKKTVLLPDTAVNLRTWMPRCVDYRDIKNFNIVGGVFYRYNVGRNLQLIKRFYPYGKDMALLTDFTFGGLIMQAHVRQRMELEKNFSLTLLDGRRYTLFEMSRKLKRLPPGTILMIGTWRIDSSENYVLANTTNVLHSANPSLPAFSLSSVGLGNWAIGGYVPEYSMQGRKLANIAYAYLHHGQKADSMFVTLPCKCTIDEKQLEAFGLSSVELPENTTLINTHKDFITENKSLVLWTLGVLLFLVCCLLFAVYDIVRIRRLKNSILQKSEELMEAKELAEKANGIKTSFIANMSHEIRTPLNAIVGFTDLIVQDEFSKEEKTQFSGIIKENTGVLLNLINEILDISRIESGCIEISSEACDVVALCHSALMSVRQASKLNSVEYLEELPDGRLEITTDRIRLRQVIMNLLANAAKFTKEGHIKLSLEVDKELQTLTFSVADTGIGVPEEKAEYIFERFAKLNQYVQGTGLGLSLCRIIVESLGGRIWLDTSYKGGACFRFTHPIIRKRQETGEVPGKK